MITYLVPHSPIPGFPALDSEGDDRHPIAVGGDLSVERLLVAYRQGIFPWFNDDNRIYWWSPDPRTVLFPDRFRVSRSLGKSIRNRGYSVTADRAFTSVIRNCALAPRGEVGGVDTWITAGIMQAYCELHRLGVAHSVETWHEGELVGGLYGVSIGRVFFGESMFSVKRDASKVALFHTVRQLRAWNFAVIDCQVPTELLLSLGAEQIPRRDFLKIVKQAVTVDQPRDLWKEFDDVETQVD